MGFLKSRTEIKNKPEMASGLFENMIDMKSACSANIPMT
jgi:hypothetical protein